MLTLAQTKLALDKQISFADDPISRALASAPSVPSHVLAAAGGSDSKAGSGASTPAIVDVDDTMRARKMKGQLLHRIRQCVKSIGEGSDERAGSSSTRRRRHKRSKPSPRPPAPRRATAEAPTPRQRRRLPASCLYCMHENPEFTP